MNHYFLQVSKNSISKMIKYPLYSPLYTTLSDSQLFYCVCVHGLRKIHRYPGIGNTYYKLLLLVFSLLPIPISLTLVTILVVVVLQQS